MTQHELKSLQEYRRSLSGLKQRIEEVRARAASTTKALDGLPRGSAERDKLSAFVAKLDALDGELTTLMADRAEVLAAAEREINDLPPQQAMIMRMRYLDGYSWRRIVREAHYDERYVFTIHARGLKNLLAD